MTRSDRVNVLNRVAGSMSTEPTGWPEDVEDGAAPPKPPATADTSQATG